MAIRTVSTRTTDQLLDEYNALFSDKTVQKVMRYIAVHDELVSRWGKKQVKVLAAKRFKNAKRAKRNGDEQVVSKQRA
jgi:hypothetical protein